MLGFENGQNGSFYPLQPFPPRQRSSPLADNEEVISAKPMPRRHHAISLNQAAQESPTLARLADVARSSNERLEAVRHLLPVPLRAQIQAGPLEDGVWCLLASSTAAAAKLRQLAPLLTAQLQGRGLAVASIRIKVIRSLS